MKNTQHETSYKFRLEVNTLPSLDKADALGLGVENVIKSVVSEGMSNLDVTVTPEMYDNNIDGVVTYKVNCGFVDKVGVDDAAFKVGCDIANAFELLGHVVAEFKIVKDTTVKDKNCSRQQDVAR